MTKLQEFNMSLTKKLHDLPCTVGRYMTEPWGSIYYNSDQRTKGYKSGLKYVISFSNRDEFYQTRDILTDLYGEPAEWYYPDSHTKGKWLNWNINTKWAITYNGFYVNKTTVKTVLLQYILAEDVELVAVD
jgi:hypothetical protein